MAPSLDNVVVLKSRELVGEPFSSLESACHIISTHEKRDWHMLDRAQIVLLSFVLVRIGPFFIVKLEALGKLALQPVLFNFDWLTIGLVGVDMIELHACSEAICITDSLKIIVPVICGQAVNTDRCELSDSWHRFLAQVLIEWVSWDRAWSELYYSVELLQEAVLIQSQSNSHLNSALRVAEVVAFVLPTSALVHCLDISIDIIREFMPAVIEVLFIIDVHVETHMSLAVLHTSVIAEIEMMTSIDKELYVSLSLW